MPLPQGLQIPGKYVRPVIKDYLQRVGYGEQYTIWLREEQDYGRDRVTPFSPLERLALDAGMKSDTLWKFLEGRNENIDFYTLDRIFCAMGNPLGYWMQWPLIVYYERANLRLPPPGYLLCAWCGEEFGDTAHPGTKRRYCSRTCKLNMHSKRYRRRHPEDQRAQTRASMQRWREANPEARKTPEAKAAHAAYMRDYRARRRAAAAKGEKFQDKRKRVAA